MQITRKQDPAVVNPASSVNTVDPTVPTVATTPQDSTIDPSLPAGEPAAQPTVNPCFDPTKANLADATQPNITANCIIRSLFAGARVTLPIQITGGAAPYALSIDWGDGLTDHKTVVDDKYYSYQHTYKNAGMFTVKLTTTDAKGVTSFLQTVVQVNGTAAADTGSTTSTPWGNIVTGLKALWTKAPLLLYVLAVALFLGMWVGNLFQRIFFVGDKNRTKHRKPPTKVTRRHA